MAYLSSLFPSCIVAVTSRPCYSAWKGEEHQTQKTQTYTSAMLAIFHKQFLSSPWNRLKPVLFFSAGQCNRSRPEPGAHIEFQQFFESNNFNHSVRIASSLWHPRWRYPQRLSIFGGLMQSWRSGDLGDHQSQATSTGSAATKNTCW